MQITIIGSGNMGRAIGTRAVAGGNEVEIIDRDAEEARSLAGELASAGAGSATAVEPGGTIGGEIVVLAVYYPSVAEIVEQYGDQLAGRVVVEITNPIDFETSEGLVVPADTSAAEQLAERLPDVTVVKAFNTTFARTLVGGEVDGHPLDVLIAGDEGEAKLRVAALAEGGGLRAIDVGPLRRARQLEQLGFLHVLLQEPLGTGYASAVKFLA